MRDLLVDPRCPISYYTYFLRGFRALGYRPVFRRLDAPRVSDRASGAAMALDGYNVYLAANDWADIDPAVFDWADVYGKVNVEVPCVGVTPLGPTFGITYWSGWRTYVAALQMATAGAAPRGSLAQLRFQAITRRPIETYMPAASQTRYVFHASRPWSGKHDGTNEPRQRFFDACDHLDINVDGGFLGERITLDDYIARTQRSAVAFNCPAVHQCLGWKLGEYLALGKAIVSTPLKRTLPAPLVHGDHIHYVDDDTDSIGAAVDLLLSDLEYRTHLEQGARSWYEEFLAPERVAARILDHLPGSP